MNKTLFIFISLTFLISCKSFKEASVTDVDSFLLNKISAEGVEAEIKLKIKNPNSIGFSLYPSQFDVVYSGIKLGKAKLHKRVHISANSERVYSFILKTNLDEFNILDATRLLDLDNMGKIELKGDLKAGKFYLKKKLYIDYSEKINLLK